MKEIDYKKLLFGLFVAVFSLFLLWIMEDKVYAYTNDTEALSDASRIVQENGYTNYILYKTTDGYYNLLMTNGNFSINDTPLANALHTSSGSIIWWNTSLSNTNNLALKGSNNYVSGVTSSLGFLASSMDIYKSSNLIISKNEFPIPDPTENYMIWAPVYDSTHSLNLNLNNRAVYKTSSDSPYYMIADSQQICCEILNPTQYELYSWGEETTYKWNDTDKIWEYVSKVNGVTIDKNLLYVNSPAILVDGDTPDIPDNQDDLLLDDGDWTLNPNIIPEYTTVNIPKVEGFKVEKENWLAPYILTWKPVFGNFYIEVRLRVNFQKEMQFPDVTMEQEYKELLIVPLSDFYNASVGGIQFSNGQIQNLLKELYPEYMVGYQWNVYGIDIRFCGRQNDKYYCNDWCRCELLFNALTNHVTKNVITYTDTAGNITDDNLIENVLDESEEQHYYGDIDLLQGTNLTDIDIADALNVTNDMITQVGQMPELMQRLMMFVPSDIWSLIFYGIALLIILRVLGR